MTKCELGALPSFPRGFKAMVIAGLQTIREPDHPSMKHRSSITRRRFIKHSALGLGSSAVGFSAPWFSRAQSSPNGQLRIAAIGTGGRAAANIAGVAHEHIAALCDVDQNLLGKASEKWPQAKRYSDFRVMLEKESEKIDAVLVGTPDHTHAPAAAMAMRLGKHVYCEAPHPYSA